MFPTICRKSKAIVKFAPWRKNKENIVDLSSQKCSKHCDFRWHVYIVYIFIYMTCVYTSTGVGRAYIYIDWWKRTSPSNQTNAPWCWNPMYNWLHIHDMLANKPYGCVSKVCYVSPRWIWLGSTPTQDASHHKDYYVSIRESQVTFIFQDCILGGGRSNFFDLWSLEMSYCTWRVTDLATHQWQS